MFSLIRPGRTEPGALRDHDAASPIPRSEDGTRVRELIRLQRDPATPPRRISVEQSPGMLCGACWQCSKRGAREVLEAFSVDGSSGSSDTSNASSSSSSSSGAAARLTSRRTSTVGVLPLRFAQAADVATRQVQFIKHGRTGSDECKPRMWGFPWQMAVAAVVVSWNKRNTALRAFFLARW